MGLKENQQELLADMARASQILPTTSSYRQLEKGHGRVESRKYDTYNIVNEYVDERWKDANFQTLVSVLK